MPLNLFKDQIVISRYDEDLKIKLNIGEWIQQHIYFLDFYEERGIKFLKNHLKKNDVFIDVGANVGSFSLIASKLVGEGGKVYSFEPIEEVYQMLIFNVGLNFLENIVAEKRAIYEKSGLLEFYVSGYKNMGTSSIFRNSSENGKIEIAEAISLDEYISKRHFEKITIIKIDIEGAEMYALKGMQSVLKKFRPVIMIEISKEILKNSVIKNTDIVDFFTSLNYTYKAISEDGLPTDIAESADINCSNYVFISID